MFYYRNSQRNKRCSNMLIKVVFFGKVQSLFVVANLLKIGWSNITIWSFKRWKNHTMAKRKKNKFCQNMEKWSWTISGEILNRFQIWFPFFSHRILIFAKNENFWAIFAKKIFFFILFFAIFIVNCVENIVEL